MTNEYKKNIKTIDATLDTNGHYVDTSTIRRKIVSASALVMVLACLALILLF
jgi:hypothetical protein